MKAQNVETLASTLNELIETSFDGEKGFKAAAERAHDPQLRALLQDYASECAQAAQELRSCASSMGVQPEHGGSATGAAHRSWMKFKTAVASNDDKALLQECERGEDYAKGSYARAVKTPLPPEVHQLVQRQYEGTVRHHDRIRQLRDRYAQA